MTLHHALRASRQTSVDPNFRNVTLLLHGDGTNGSQNNTFIDSSTNNFGITRNGNTTQGTFTPYGQGWSNYFDGNGDWLQISNNSAFNLSSSNFTIEAWVYPTTSGTDRQIVSKNQGGYPGGFEWNFTLTSTNVLQFNGFGSSYFEVKSTATVPVNTWTHVAAVRNGSTITLYRNGVVDGTTTAQTIQTISANVTIGRDLENAGGGRYFTGYISNLRVVKGTAQYTAAFIPPTAPLTAITNTSLLTCQSNRFIDNSSNAFTITRNGDVSVQRFNPFAPGGDYMPAVNGGSGYFDGTGDSLSLPTSGTITLSTNDFTFETWIYRNVVASNEPVWAMKPSGRFSTGFENSGTIAQIGIPGVAYIARISTTVPLLQWFHFAVTKSSNVYRVFINGTQIGTTYTNTTSISAGTAGIAQFSDGTGSINAYFSDTRLVNGTALYTSNFTPPTVPLTAVTNTSFLLNYINGAIIDQAGTNDLETVGDAQISTSIKKFGTGSLAFDGTGDWLTIADNINNRLGTANFTVEGWVYLNATGVARGFVGKGTGTTGWLLSVNSSNQVVFTYGSSTITSTGTLAGSTWYHLAVVRGGTGTNQTKIYLNGTNDGTGTVSTDFNQTNIMYVGADRTGGSALNGYIDDLRITRGVARYTANFTPPTTPFPNR